MKWFIYILFVTFVANGEESSYIERKKIVQQKFYENCKELGIKCNWGGDIINNLPPIICKKGEHNCTTTEQRGNKKYCRSVLQN